MVEYKPRVVARSSMVTQVEAFLREMVLNGELAPGERLNEVILSESIGTSRGPLREAISRLAGQGLLSVETHRGAYVKEYSPEEIVDLYQLRAAIELYSFRLVAENASDEDILSFAEQIQSHAAKESQSANREGEVQKESAYLAEFDFHRHLVKMSGNELFLSELNSANEKLFLALSQTKRTKDRQRHSATSHGEIAEALANRKIDEGLDLLREHLRDSMRNSLVVMGLGNYLDELDLLHVI